MSLRSSLVFLFALAIAAPSAAQQRSNDAVQKTGGDVVKKMMEDYSKPVLGYSLTLLAGETESSPLPDGLSPQARKALADVKDFLPFKGYRILDTQWFAGSDGGATVHGNFRGLTEAQLLPFTLSASRLNQKFTLWKDQSSIVLDVTFTQHVGETVVVGTSKIQGDKALIVLMTIVEGKR